jgi:hypothetical protein
VGVIESELEEFHSKISYSRRVYNVLNDAMHYLSEEVGKGLPS